MDAAIVVVGYNRVDSLERVLSSLLVADYGGDDIALYISLDGSSIQSSIIDKLKSFKWPNGQLEIIAYDENIGLKTHILKCGDLTSFHDFIIVLEDDISVSKCFYEYAKNAFLFYSNSDDVFAISLYSPRFNESALQPFVPSLNACTYMMQLPCSWGQIWFNRTWSLFRVWLENSSNINYEKLPSNIQRWSDKSWKKDQLVYLMENDLYYVYPVDSYSNNFGDVGEHVKGTFLFQVALKNYHSDFCFLTSKDPDIVFYDAWMERKYKLEVDSGIVDIEFDLYGMKKNYNSQYVVTSKISTKPLKKYLGDRLPLEENILLGLEDKKGLFTLSESKYVKPSMRHRLKIFLRTYNLNLSLSLLSRLLGRI